MNEDRSSSARTGISSSLRRPDRRLALAATVLLAGCDAGGDPSGPGGAAQVEISAPSTSVELGQKLLLSATVKDASGQRLRNVQVSWTSSDPAVAEVAEGMVTGRSPGHVYVRATAGAARDSLRVTVESPPVGEIVVRPDTLYLIRGRVGRLFVEVRDPAGRPMANSLLFSSSAPEIAPVSDSGEVQGVALGSAAVTVTAGLRSVQVPVRVVTGERYSVTYLGTLGGTTPYRHSYMASREHLAPVRVLSAVLSSAHDVNNRGEVVGGAVTAAGQWHAYLWRGGRMTDLGAPPGLAWSEALALNDRGAVVGVSRLHQEPPPFHDEESRPWLHRNGGFTLLVDSVHSFVFDLNDRGQAVGARRSTGWGDLWGRSYLWEAGRHTFLEVAGATGSWTSASGSYGGAINGRGVVGLNLVFGNLTARPYELRAYVLENGAATPVPRPVPSAQSWTVAELNDRGQLVGTYWTRSPVEPGYTTGAYLWDGSRSTDLAPMKAGMDINGHGEVVGGNFLYRGGQVLDLRQISVSGEWQVVDATGINDLGWISVTGSHRTRGGYGALLLKPIS